MFVYVRLWNVVHPKDFLLLYNGGILIMPQVSFSAYEYLNNINQINSQCYHILRDFISHTQSERRFKMSKFKFYVSCLCLWSIARRMNVWQRESCREKRVLKYYIFMVLELSQTATIYAMKNYTMCKVF